jgi:hypothetical protein
MPEYRFYAINEDGHIGVPPTQYELPNDDAANEKAKQLLDGHDIEIWQGARIVAHFNSKETP